MRKCYTGVGSRETPADILAVMTRLAQCLARDGWTLRSGRARGADRAFEAGAGRAKEIFLAKHATQTVMDMASRIHPAWHRCDDFARRLHGRNCFQVLGHDLNSPSRFLVCWTRDGLDQGGTRTAITLARQNGVPVFNLAIRSDFERIASYIRP